MDERDDSGRSCHFSYIKWNPAAASVYGICVEYSKWNGNGASSDHHDFISGRLERAAGCPAPFTCPASAAACQERRNR